MDYKSLFTTINTIHELTNKNRLVLFFDIIYCAIKYGAAVKDYFLFEFYLLNKAERSTYVTRVINNKITRLLNDRNYYHYFDNKDEFYTIFSDFIGRRWLPLKTASANDFINFIETIEEVIIKPINGSCGVGVEKLNKADFENLDELYSYAAAKRSMIIEEVILQHNRMNELYP
jgi:glutathione synthase/RimK-type ligase-like ATP-grasp enzyme